MRTTTTTREVLLDTDFPEFIHLKKEHAVLPAEYPATYNQNGYRHREEKNNGIIWPNIRPLLIRPDTSTGKKEKKRNYMAEYPATSDQTGYRHREEKNNGIIWPDIRCISPAKN